MTETIVVALHILVAITEHVARALRAAVVNGTTVESRVL